MNYPNPQDQEGTEYFHSFTDSPPITTFSSSSTTTPSPLAIASTTMTQNSLYINDEWHPSYVTSNLTENSNSSSSMAGSMAFNFLSSSSYASSITPTTIIGNASSFHPAYYPPVPTTTPVPISPSSFSPSLSSSSYTTGYFTSINGIIHSSVPSQSHYSHPSFEYAHYAPQQQQSTSTPPPPLPLQIQHISQQQHNDNNNQPRARAVGGESGRRRRRRRRQDCTNTSSTSSSPSPTSSSSGLVENVFQEPRSKRQRYHRHSSDPSSSTSRMVSTESCLTSLYSNSVTPLPSPVLQRENLEINIREGDRGGGGGGGDGSDSGSEEIKIEEEEKEEKLLKQQQNIEKGVAGGINKSEPATTSVPSQQKQKTVKDIETELSFLRDECATILMMLESLRNAFLADETNKQIQQEITVKTCSISSSSSKNKKTSSVVKDRKLAMEREMRIAYDDLMLQVRQLERKVEKLEGKSKLICKSERG